MNDDRTRAYVALGANLGDAEATLRWAVGELDGLGTVEAVSRLYRTAPVGGPPGQPDYLNAALRLSTPLGPHELLWALHDLEAQAGRVRSERWAARPLDLDLILYGDLTLRPDAPDGLTLPHPRAWERSFVLAPLRDLDPELRHPLIGERVPEALERLGEPGLSVAQAADWVGTLGEPAPAILPPGTPFLTSWSGGKDSALAYWHAAQTGRPLAVLSVLDEEGARSRSHGLSPEVLGAQAAALGVPLWSVHASWETYEAEFTALLRRGREAGARAAVFGDIDLEGHREWEEKVCGAAGLTPALPLWQRPRRELVEEGLRLGLRAMIVTVRDSALPAGLLGRTLDLPLLDELERLGADACGENGEYHTCVYDHPLFSHPLRLRPGARSRVGEGEWAATTLAVELA